MSAEAVRTCLNLTSGRRSAARATRIGSSVSTHRVPERTWRTTIAFLVAEKAGPTHVVTTGHDISAARRAAESAAERADVTWPPVQPEDVVDIDDPHLPSPDIHPSDLLAELLSRIAAPPGVVVSAEAHIQTERRILQPDSGPVRRETTTAAAVVVDLLNDGTTLADADLAWSSDTPPDLDVVATALDEAVVRAGMPPLTAPGEVQLLLLDGCAGALLHEICGHLLESTRTRPSLVADDMGDTVASRQLTIVDKPQRRHAFGAHRYTMLGAETADTDLITSGRLAGLLADTPGGPWRGQDVRYGPQPRMTHLETAAAPSSRALDQALGECSVPVVEVHRLGLGSLDHRSGTVAMEVRDGVLRRDGRAYRLEPFRVVAEARQTLREIRAVGADPTVATWSAYCLARSGCLPVGATTPAMLTGVLPTLTR